MAQDYPAERYHAHQKSRVVKSAAEDEALGDAWYDSPKKAAASKRNGNGKGKASQSED